ncbi:MAG: Crp/Fnr family transcriptional regulator [Alphaproteobacteria bacterium]|nr:Crp/Fnr family transcriptional regulator [Alphaproteobacteria bacterium]
MLNKTPPHEKLARRLGLEDEAAQLVAGAVQAVPFKAGDTLFAPGRACEGFIILESGRVKVMVTAGNGRQIVLYHLASGQSCIVTTACLMANSAYEAEALAESDGLALVLGKAKFQALMDVSPRFRGFVFQGFAGRLGDVLGLMQTVMDRRVDRRLAALLAGGAPELKLTQQAIAQELGTAREVVSRHLKEFEQKGWLAVKRGRIAIARPQQLLDFAAEV